MSKGENVPGTQHNCSSSTYLSYTTHSTQRAQLYVCSSIPKEQ